MRKTSILVFIICTLTLLADVSVTKVEVKPRWPWSGLVDVTYTIEGGAGEYCSVTFTGHDKVRNEDIDMKSMSGVGTTRFLLSSGTHTATWNAAKDVPGLHTPSFTVSVDATPTAPLYLVVDLSGGATANRYPVGYTTSPPDLGDPACRTTELWLRLIPKGKFTMGSPDGETGQLDDETQHEVELTRDYYVGVFECTQRQWQLVMGDRPSFFRNDAYYATRPVEQVSYEDIRGNSPTGGAGWPEYGNAVDSDSFMGRLRKRTGLLAFDLPTEAEWEYACRAGTTTALNSGKDLTGTVECSNMADVGRYWYNGVSEFSEYCTTDNGTAKAGTYRPNDWGLYDMHGNVYEWCLDWYGDYPTEAVTDPQGASAGSVRVQRGGSWYSIAQYCRSAYRSNGRPSSRNSYDGFRVAFRP